MSRNAKDKLLQVTVLFLAPTASERKLGWAYLLQSLREVVTSRRVTGRG